MRLARLAFAIGLVLVAVALAVTLSTSPLSLAATNGVASSASLSATNGNASACQSRETVPAGTSAIRLSLETVIGPWVSVSVHAGGRLLAHGRRGDGWPAASVTVPVTRVARTTAHATVCFSIGRSYKRVSLLGEETGPALAAVADGKPLPGRLSIEYLRPGRRSWWSLASAVAQRIGLGHESSGDWAAILAGLLDAAVLVLSSWLAVRGRSLPRACWICALVACLNAICWSIITPPFEVPDEPAHFAYVQYLAETGHLPSSGEETYSVEEATAMNDLDAPQVILRPQVTSIVSRSQERKLQQDLALPLRRVDAGDAGVAASEPPLYYALETIPYGVASSASLLDRLQLMRLLSALLAGLTGLFSFLFVRETLPSTPWAWTVGGLGVALVPLLAEMSGGVNPDVLLYASSAALFYCLARAFRRGLTPRMAAAIGAVTATGLLTKLNFLGLVPGVLLALVLLSVRARRAGGSDAWRSAAIAVSLAAGPLLVYVVANVLSNRAGLGVVASAVGRTRHAGSLLGEIGYVWQLYMPALPGMHRDFPELLTTLQIWFDGYVGLLGWLDTTFPNWVYDAALVPAALIAVLCLLALARDRAALRERVGELAVYVVLAAGLMTLVGAGSYLAFVGAGGIVFEPRYLLPLVPLLGLGIALAARGAGSRWGPAVGVLIVALFLAHDLFSQLQVLARYYG